MGNMSYARFQNTLSDLQECCDYWDQAESPEELRAQRRLLQLCLSILKDYGDDDVSNMFFALKDPNV